jgi:hypothetical protein
MITTALTETSRERSPNFQARAAGFLWLMTILTGSFAFFVISKSYVTGDPAATAAYLRAHETMYRLAFVINLVATACYLGVTVFIYILLKIVNKNVALLGAFFSLAGCAVGLSSALFLLAPLSILGSASLGAFTPAQLQAQALTALSLSLQSNDIGMTFFGLHVITIGYLIRRSTFLPHILGALLFLTGVCYLTNSVSDFLILPFRTYLMPFVAIGGLLGEGSLTVWLLAKGIDVHRWQKQAGVSAGWRPPRAVHIEPVST